MGGRAGGPLSAVSTGQGVSADGGSTCGDREVTTQGLNTGQGDCRRQGRVMLTEVPPAMATCLCQGEWVPTSGPLSAAFSHFLTSIVQQPPEQRYCITLISKVRTLKLSDLLQVKARAPQPLSVRLIPPPTWPPRYRQRQPCALLLKKNFFFFVFANSAVHFLGV